MAPITTSVTQLLGVQHPILLAGMGYTAGPELVAAVSNAGGLGVLGGIRMKPQALREAIAEVKQRLSRPDLPFGVDLLIPKLGDGARKTNVDYTKGALDELVDIIIEEGAKLFVSAVGVPPKSVVERLHKAGILYMNMVGHPKHVEKACAVGADLICAQGGEGGGHTGDIPTSVLIPACADVCSRHHSPLTGQPVQLVAAGGMFDGRSLAAALMMGARAVWVGTRFVTSRESSAPPMGKKAIVDAGFTDTIRTTLWTGRPLRALGSPYLRDWEQNRRKEIEELQERGQIVLDYELDRLEREGLSTEEIEDQSTKRPMGCCAAMVTKMNQPAAEIVEEMVREGAQCLQEGGMLLDSQPKL